SKPQNGVADPEGRHVLVLARDPQGYGRLCAAITAAQLAGEEKGRPVFDLSALAQAAGGHWLVLTGCRKGTVPSALASAGPAAAFAGRDRRMAAAVGGRPPAVGGRTGAPVRPVPGGGGAGGGARVGVRLRPEAGGARTARLPGARRAHRDDVVA